MPGILDLDEEISNLTLDSTGLDMSKTVNITSPPTVEILHGENTTQEFSFGSEANEEHDTIGDLPTLDSKNLVGPPAPSTVSDANERDTLMKYRPSDMADDRQSALTRDSLMTGRPTDMSTTLAQMDENYRMSVNTKIESEKELAPLLSAAKRGDLSEVNALLENSMTDIVIRDSHHGQSALHYAVRSGHISVVRALCNPSIVESIINLPDNRRNTALHLAAVKSRRITKVLLENGAEVDAYNLRNQTALGVHVLTTKKDDPILAEMLLQHNADPNCTLDQSTVLHVAIDRSLFEIAGRLVRHGARLDVKDENDKMAFDKVNRRVLRKLIGKISYPPVWIPNEEKSSCMICSSKFSKLSMGVRRHHCRHCGRIVCGECSHLSVESFRFPKSFNNRLKPGAKANQTHRRVCKTCYGVFKDRMAAESNEGKAEGRASKFYKRVVGYTWDEVNAQVNNPVVT